MIELVQVRSLEAIVLALSATISVFNEVRVDLCGWIRVQHNLHALHGVSAVKESLDQERHHRVQADIAGESPGARAEQWEREARETQGIGVVETAGHDLPQNVPARQKDGPDINARVFGANRNDIMDQSISFTGAPVDRATFQYTADRFLSETVDDLSFEPVRNRRQCCYSERACRYSRRWPGQGGARTVRAKPARSAFLEEA
jgi:hypothetical protein